MSVELFSQPTIWFVIAVVLMVLEGFDGSFSIFATSSLAAFITSMVFYITAVLHPLSVFFAALLVSYAVFRYIFKRTTDVDDINDLTK